MQKRFDDERHVSDLFKEGIKNKITGNSKKFFNLGPNNDWNKVLDGSLVEEIVNKFQKEMKELKYI